MEVKGHVIIRTLGLYIIMFCLLFDEWTGAGAYFDDFLYYIYQDEGIVSGLCRILLLCGGWYFLVDMIAGLKNDGASNKN